MIPRGGPHFIPSRLLFFITISACGLSRPFSLVSTILILFRNFFLQLQTTEICMITHFLRQWLFLFLFICLFVSFCMSICSCDGERLFFLNRLLCLQKSIISIDKVRTRTEKCNIILVILIGPKIGWRQNRDITATMKPEAFHRYPWNPFVHLVISSAHIRAWDGNARTKQHQNGKMCIIIIIFICFTRISIITNDGKLHTNARAHTQIPLILLLYLLCCSCALQKYNIEEKQISINANRKIVVQMQTHKVDKESK